MMKGHSVIMVKRGVALMAEDSLAQDMLRRIPEGMAIRANITVPRNVKHHRKLFVLLQLVYDSQIEPKMFATVEGLLDAIKIATGHVRTIVDLQGKLHFVPQSISFGAMSQLRFEEFYNQAINLILEKVLPNCARQDIEQQIYNILGEPGPDALRR